MFDLSRFQSDEMAPFGAALRTLAVGANDLRQVAERMVRFLYENLANKESHEQSCALVRFFKTYPYQGLSPELRKLALEILAQERISPTMPCLTLLATAGDEPQWNSSHLSVAHRLIPLASEQAVAEMPMISQLIKQLGVDVPTLLRADPRLLLDLELQTYNVFHVPDAHSSPYVPCQDEFVIPYRIKSVLGFGGMLPAGDLFAVIMFSKTTIPRHTADLFKILTQSAKVAVLAFANEAA